MEQVDRAWVEDLVRRNRYLVLATTDGSHPWATPLEYVVGEQLELYDFSTGEARHTHNVAANPEVGVTIFESQQDYSGQASFALKAVQIEATVVPIRGPDFPQVVADTIERWKLPMPPYACHRIDARQFYLPLIEDGINYRVPIDMSWRLMPSREGP